MSRRRGKQKKNDNEIEGWQENEKIIKKNRFHFRIPKFLRHKTTTLWKPASS